MTSQVSLIWRATTAAILIVVVVAVAMAIGQWLTIRTDGTPAPNGVAAFRPIGMLPAEARPQALVAQPNGDALVVGAEELFRFDSEVRRFTLVARLQIPRTLPATVVLQDGRVLIVGGGHDGSSVVPPDGYRAEIYDPIANVSTLTGPTVDPRAWGTATLLDDGRVLVIGGEAAGFAVATAEIFNPETGAFVETASLSRPRSYHAAVLLADGHVIVVGGAGSDEQPSAELYDPTTGTFAPAGPMVVPQATGFSAVELADGRVLLTGGWDHEGNLLSAAQAYDPVTGRFTQTESLPAPRHAHSAALLEDGRVLIVGGWGTDAIAEGDDAFIYDPVTDQFMAIAPLGVQRLAPFVVTLHDGAVLVVGSQCWNQGCYGLDNVPRAADREVSAEIFD